MQNLERYRREFNSNRAEMWPTVQKATAVTSNLKILPNLGENVRDREPGFGIVSLPEVCEIAFPAIHTTEEIFPGGTVLVAEPSSWCKPGSRFVKVEYGNAPLVDSGRLPCPRRRSSRFGMPAAQAWPGNFRPRRDHLASPMLYS